MISADKAALRALAEKAAPGPWKSEQAFGGFGALLTHDGTLIFGLAHGTTDERFTDKEQVPHDYAYLSAAHPAAVLALLDEVDRLREALVTMWQLASCDGWTLDDPPRRAAMAAALAALEPRP